MNQFEPDWMVTPGELILDHAEERGLSRAELAHNLGYNDEQMTQLCDGAR